MNAKEKLPAELELMPENVSLFTGTHVRYVLVECSTPGCGHRWGVTPQEDGSAPISQFLCRDCFAKQILNS